MRESLITTVTDKITLGSGATSITGGLGIKALEHEPEKFMSALTLAESMAVVGGVVAVLSFFVNTYYRYKKDKREEERHLKAFGNE